MSQSLLERSLATLNYRLLERDGLGDTTTPSEASGSLRRSMILLERM